MASRHSRKKPTRHLTRIYKYAAEGEVTEREYFEALNIEFGKTIKLQRVTSKSSSKMICEALNKAKQRSKKSHEKIEGFIAVFDRELTPARIKEAEEAKQIARCNDLICIESNPSFEFWILLHFRDRDITYSSESQLINEVAEYIDGYSQNNKSVESAISQLMENRNLARNRAKKLTKTGVFESRSDMHYLLDLIEDS